MVNTGRPSRNCIPCRKRKLRCDLRAGNCSQCQRARLICYGYRNPNELLIRDETHSTKQKALARQSQTDPTLPIALQLGWDVRARDAFFSSYVFGISRSHNALPPLYAQATPSGHLFASVDAVSLALMSFQLNAPELSHLANKKYVIAIQRASQAVQNPEVSVSDETLQSVLLLDLYEKMVNRNPQSSASWMSHIQGAMALVKARGSRNFSNHITFHLAIRLVSTLVISCGAANVPVPKALIELRRDLNAYIHGAKWSFTAVVVDIVNFEADLNSGKFASSAEAARRAWELDCQLLSIETTIPPSWKPRRVFHDDSDPRIFGRSYDVYPNHFVTQFLNASRLLRLAMNDIVQTHGRSNEFNPETNVSDNITNITLQICAAVPQFIHPCVWPGNQVPFTPLQKLRCCTLLAPLFLAGRLSRDPYIKGWISQSFDFMADTGNMKIAREVGSLLRTKPDASYWTVYAMSGSYAFAA